MEFGILNFIQDNLRSPVMDVIMPWLSYIGENGLIWIVICIAMLFFKKSRRFGVLALIALSFVFVVGELGVKNIVERVRPCNVPGVNIDMLVEKPSSFSFPSGHSSSSFAVATIIFIWDKRFGIPALILAGAIAFSRMYVYVHFPTDVLVGVIFGIVGAVLTYYIYKKFFLKKEGALVEQK